MFAVTCHSFAAPSLSNEIASGIPFRSAESNKRENRGNNSRGYETERKPVDGQKEGSELITTRYEINLPSRDRIKIFIHHV
jgi:hypothetical protein